jgi:hypothetical protein
MKPTLAELSVIDIRRTYRALRKRYFAESEVLAVASVSILYAEKKRIGNMCESEDGCHGGCLPVCDADGVWMAAVIFLAKEDDEVQAHLTLLHEMAHMAVDIKWQRGMGHGKNWQAEMRRLAEAGAFDSDW